MATQRTALGSISTGSAPAGPASRCSSDEDLLDAIEHAAVDYFLESVNPANGLVPDTSRAGSPCSIAVVGFALSVYPIAVERGWASREQVL